jgi:hypothetical protein
MFQPTLPLRLGDGQDQRAVTELRQIFHDPSPPRERARQWPDTRGIHKTQLDISLLAATGQEMA